MTPLLFIALGMQAEITTGLEAQARRITETDASLILEAVIEYWIPRDPTLEGRPVVVAREKASAAFSRAAPELAPRIFEALASSEAYTVRPQDEVLRCPDAQLPAVCEATTDAVVFDVYDLTSTAGRRWDQTGELYVVETVTVADDRAGSLGFVVSRTRDGWRVTSTVFMEY